MSADPTPIAAMVAAAQAWQAERQRILDEEAETGVLDEDAIHDSDDEACNIAGWVATALWPQVHAVITSLISVCDDYTEGDAAVEDARALIDATYAEWRTRQI